jgi:spore coat polysaccharide biosynthesis predicted glycosyltransferase SpsG
MKRIFIRFDASPEIGLGHARRCVALAHALKEHSINIVFALRIKDITVQQLRLPEGCTWELLPWKQYTLWSY